jgi:hypothetical protein
LLVNILRCIGTKQRLERVSYQYENSSSINVITFTFPRSLYTKRVAVSPLAYSPAWMVPSSPLTSLLGRVTTQSTGCEKVTMRGKRFFPFP